ncbi:MAG: DUF2341 domain-containing protein [Candidatus Cloacimonadaceae bacterium]|nr:DUF2341 domain-containing protein [Candidatus Cloacimonadaceae bacterium]MDP3114494.1 DUF2341 domain-containing protein [Candidatus Cloacimonadaceae bacterium]
MKLKSIIIFILMLGIVSSSYAAWWYSKDQVISQLANAGTDYQVRVIAHYGAGSSIGENVYLNSNGRTDFGDVRFFEGITPLNYWMESMTTSSVAVFWVKLAGNLSLGAVTLTIKYGNPTATTTSNGDNTLYFLR